MAMMKCPECGSEISDAAKACPHCGFPVSEAKPETFSSRRNGTILKVVIACFVVSVVAVFAYVRFSAATKHSAYVSELSSLRADMLAVAAQSEGQCNLVRRVWLNTVEHKNDSTTNKYTIKPSEYTEKQKYYYDTKFNDDFNVSLRALYSDESITAVVSSIQSSRDDISARYGKMQNLPDDLSGCQTVLKEMYDALFDLTDCAIRPEGTLITYTSKYSEADNRFLLAYEKLGPMIPSSPPAATN